MKKSELVTLVAEKTGFSKKDTENPRTGEEINIAAATMPVFKPGKVLKDKVDGNK